MKYAVIDDYGDEPYDGRIAFEADTLQECYQWAEGENYHSASIVKINKKGERKVVK